MKNFGDYKGAKLGYLKALEIIKRAGHPLYSNIFRNYIKIMIKFRDLEGDKKAFLT